jgi:hypothetical protein
LGGSREEAEALLEVLLELLVGGRRGWRLLRSAGSADGATLRAPELGPLGERVILRAGEGWLHVASRSTVPVQTLDWGKNFRNVERVRKAAERALGRPVRPA